VSCLQRGHRRGRAGLPYHAWLLTEQGSLNGSAGRALSRAFPWYVALACFSVLNRLVRVQAGRTLTALARALQVAATTVTEPPTRFQARRSVWLQPNTGAGGVAGQNGPG
jgi:hypothetical protein